MAMFNCYNNSEGTACTKGGDTGTSSVTKLLTDDTVGRTIPVFRDAYDQSTMASYFPYNGSIYKMDKSGVTTLIVSKSSHIGNNITGSYNGNGSNLYLVSYNGVNIIVVKIPSTGNPTIKEITASYNIASVAINILNEVYYSYNAAVNATSATSCYVRKISITNNFADTAVSSKVINPLRTKLIPNGVDMYLMAINGTTNESVTPYLVTTGFMEISSPNTYTATGKIIDIKMIDNTKVIILEKTHLSIHTLDNIGSAEQAFTKIITLPITYTEGSTLIGGMSIIHHGSTGYTDVYLCGKNTGSNSCNGIFSITNIQSIQQGSTASPNILMPNAEYFAENTNYTGYLAAP